MLNAIKIRIYPNEGQQQYLEKLFGCYRLIYNKSLNYKIREYTENNNNIGFSELGKYFHQNLLKDDNLEFLKEHNTKVLKQSIIDLLDAYKRFFVNGNGFPNFKSKYKHEQTARFINEAISKKNVFLDNRVTLTKDLKNIRFRCSKKYRQYLYDNKNNIKSATLTKTKSGKYFLSVLVDGDHDENKMGKPINDIIGIDIGIKDFIVDSNGNKYENLKLKRNNEKKIKKLHRQLSKKQKGSKNYEKCRKRLAKFYEHLDNKKEQHLHSIANSLLNENQVIAMENLNIKGMMKNDRLSKSLQELSANKFKQIIKYKAKWYGRDIVEIDRWFASSKLCSNCGWKNDNLKLSDRKWKCPQCGKKHDRDENASKNIENEGNKILIGHRMSELKPLEIDNAGDSHVVDSSIQSMN